MVPSCLRCQISGLVQSSVGQMTRSLSPDSPLLCHFILLGHSMSVKSPFPLHLSYFPLIWFLLLFLFLSLFVLSTSTLLFFLCHFPQFPSLISGFICSFLQREVSYIHKIFCKKYFFIAFLFQNKKRSR